MTNNDVLKRIFDVFKDNPFFKCVEYSKYILLIKDSKSFDDPVCFDKDIGNFVDFSPTLISLDEYKEGGKVTYFRKGKTVKTVLS